VFLFCLISPLLVFASNIETKLSSDHVEQGDIFTLSFIQHHAANNGQQDAAAVSHPDFSALEKDFKILSNNYGSSFQNLNGVMTAETFWQLSLSAKTSGKLVIPVIQFGNEKSLPGQITVSEKKIINDALPTPTSPVFLQATIDHPSAYIQSQLIYTLKIFYKLPLQNTNIEMPQSDDLMFMDLGKDKSYETTLQGQRYAVVEKQLALFAKNSGAIEIPATHLTAVIYDNSQNFSNPFMMATPQQISRDTHPINVTVIPIPPAFKSKAWLPATQLKLSERWSQDVAQWSQGEPITRTIVVDADGLRADQLPDINLPKLPNANVYVDAPKRENKIIDHHLVGHLEQTVTYILNTPRRYTIPAIQLRWWNVQTDTEDIAQLPALDVDVKGVLAMKATPITQPATESNSLPLPLPVMKQPSKFKNLMIIVFIFLLLLLMIIYAVYKRKKRPNKVAEKKANHVLLLEKEFLQACRRNDAKLALRYLLQLDFKDETLLAEKNKLQAYFYGNHSQPWQGEDLLRAYQAWRALKPSQAKTVDKPILNALPPLNPL